MVKAIPMEDWLRGCIYHDGRHGYVTLPIDKVHQIANYIQRTRRSGMDGLIDLEVVEADRKTEPSDSEIPNNSTISKMEQVEDEPQTGTEIARAIVHKMIDDAVLAEDAYPNLRQKMHDAVDEYEPQTDIHGITDCDFCKHGSEEWDSEACDGCCNANNHFEPKDKPQTDVYDYKGNGKWERSE